MHVEWWSELAQAWEAGLLPDIVPEPSQAASDLKKRMAELRALVPADTTALTDAEVVTVAARMEFHMLSPIFEELVDLVEPMQAKKRKEAYRHHLDHLVLAIEGARPDDPLVSFLAQVLKRVSSDNRSLARHATRDALTGLRNRRSLDGHIRQWAAWAARYRHPLGVALVDVDEFKSINDTFGHEAGDRALAAVANVLADTVRASDLVARYGGDEFVVLAPESGEQDMSTLSERIVAAVRQIRLEASDGRIITPTVSTGAAVLLPDGGSPLSIEDALSLADQSLYAAKLGGRDQAGGTVVADAHASPRL